MAHSITNPNWQAHAQVQVTAALAGAGQHEQAEAVAHSITTPDGQTRPLVEVAAALAGAGQHEQAEAVAHSITTPDAQAHALAELARTMAQAGNFQYACRVAAASCAVGRWTVAAASVLLLDPCAFPTLERVLAER